MKQLTVFSMFVLITLAVSTTSLAQDAEQLRLMELQARIQKLQLEIEALQIQQDNYNLNGLPAQPRANTMRPENPQLRLSPPEPIQLQESPYLTNEPQRHQQYRGVYTEPQAVPVIVPQRIVAPAIAQPGFGGPFCPQAIGGSGAVYIGPNGWGFGVGGLNFNFGYGHGHGHRHHKHHRGYRDYDDD